mgnify:CR=1 FL=1
MVSVKKIETKDFYPTMVEWWKGNNFNVVTPSLLPQYTYVVLNDNDIPTYSMCFYNTDSHLAWIGWQLKNPDVDKKDSVGNLSFLFEQVEKEAKALGYHLLFTTSNTKPVEDVMIDLGYNVGDTGVKHYSKVL